MDAHAVVVVAPFCGAELQQNVILHARRQYSFFAVAHSLYSRHFSACLALTSLALVIISSSASVGHTLKYGVVGGRICRPVALKDVLQTRMRCS